MCANSSTQSFNAFYEGWLIRHENLLHELLSVSTMPDSPTKTNHEKGLMEKILSHYQQYQEEKSRLINDDVFVLLSPTWLSPYERALLWIGGYRPSLILRLADGAVTDLTSEQKEAIEQVKAETRRVERELSEAMAGVQESVASPHVLGLMRHVGRVLDGEIGELDEAIEGLKRAFVEVAERADELRVSTVRKVVGSLSLPQTLQFLTAAMHFQLRARKGGFGV